MTPGAFRAATAAGPVFVVLLVLLVPPTGTESFPLSPHPFRTPGAMVVASAVAGAAPVFASPAPAASPSPSLDRGGWVNRTAALGVGPPPRWGAALGYDVADGYLVLFGGIGNSHQPLRDTWTFADNAWHNVTAIVGTAPSARSDAAMAYDVALGGLVLYGGIHLGTYQADTWLFRSGQWSQVSTNTSAGPLADPGLVYDPVARELVLFGGAPHPGSAVRNATFTFANGQWTNATASAGMPPPAMDRPSMVWDSRLNATVLFGGMGSKVPYNGTWEFSFGRWSSLAPKGPTLPGPRDGAVLADDLADGYDLLFGGLDAGVSLEDTWAYAGGNWTELPESTEPSPRNEYAMAYTPGPLPGTAEVVLFGGRFGSTVNATGMGDTWTYKLPLQAQVSANVSAVDVGRSLTVGLLVAGGYPPYSVNWTDLPTGCAGPSTTQSFPCTPQFVGPVDFQATVNDSAGIPTNATGQNVTVNAVPTVTVSAIDTNGPAPLTVHFQVTLSGGTAPYTYAWNFGNGNGTSSGNTAHLYSRQGEYTAELAVTDADGDVADSSEFRINATATLSVLAIPSATYGWTPFVVTFSSQVTGGEAPYSYAWSLGVPGPLYTQPYARENYTVPGTYEVVLTVHDALNETNRSYLNVSVVAPLTGNFAASFPGGPTCVGTRPTVTGIFIAQPAGGSSSYNETWSINGSAYYGPTPSVTFNGGGPVPVNLTVTDARGNRTYVEHPVIVPTTSCAPVAVTAGGVPPPTLHLYTVVALVIVAVIVLEAIIFIRGRRSSGPGP